MIVKAAEFLASLGGDMGNYWLRPLPGRPGWAVVCKKPEYTKRDREEMGKRKQVRQFSEDARVVSAILKDPVQKAEWQARWRAAANEEMKHPHRSGAHDKPYLPQRLCDFIRQELAQERKRKEKGGTDESR